MSTPAEGNEGWNKEKEKLKLKFETIINKYSMFEGGDKTALSEKLRLSLAKTKEELHKIIAAI